MMTSVFLKILNMCLSASWIVLAVMAVRMVLYRAPKWVRPLLWGIVGIRLICPFSIESIFSLIPSAEVVNKEIVYSGTPSVHSGVSAIDRTVNHALAANLAPIPESGVNPMQVIVETATVLWIVGMAIMLIYSAVSYFRIKLLINTAVRREATDCRYKVSQSEYVKYPFVIGFLAPEIIIPYALSKESIEYVLCHETAHIDRGDHWWKTIGFLLLSVYWFNPLFWVAYILLCRDIESACDERVIMNLSQERRAEYSQALLACSVSHRRLSASPLAFGETNVKSRIKQILSYKKPAFWLTSVAVVSCAALVLCFLTDPKIGGEQDKSGENSRNYLENIEGSISNEASSQMDGVSDGTSSNESSAQIDIASDGDSDKAFMSGEPQDEAGIPSDIATVGLSETQMKVIEAAVYSWADAFVSKDGNQIVALSSEELRDYLASEEGGELLDFAGGGYSFGMSSPWPWGDNSYAVYDLGYENRTAIIYYYAMTSEPHVTVWKEILSYNLVGDEIKFVEEKLVYYDNISSIEEFLDAYAMGISGTMMDYEQNGLGEALNTNAALASSMQYVDLFGAATAAVSLLNLDPERAKVIAEKEETPSLLTMLLSFDESDEPYRFSMEMPFSESGIWVPENYKTTVSHLFSAND